MINRILLAIVPLITFSVQDCTAHFGMLIPEQNVINQEKKSIQFNLAFAHPFENIGMELVKPKKFSVTIDGQTTDLTDTLRPATFMQHGSWETGFTFKKPGVYHFVMEPAPYWEQGEDVSIIHYTKTIIGAFGDDQGWDTPSGLPAEIIPLLRPFGNYAGNSFTGQVLLGGKPAPSTLVEVELYNRGNGLRAPTDYHITQVIKTDGNGIFNFTCPLSGWWGFAALHEADYTIKDPKGNEKGVEIGAVLWIYLAPFDKNTLQ